MNKEWLENEKESTYQWYINTDEAGLTENDIKTLSEVFDNVKPLYEMAKVLIYFDEIFRSRYWDFWLDYIDKNKKYPIVDDIGYFIDKHFRVYATEYDKLGKEYFNVDVHDDMFDKHIWWDDPYYSKYSKLGMIGYRFMEMLNKMKSTSFNNKEDVDNLCSEICNETKKNKDEIIKIALDFYHNDNHDVVIKHDDYDYDEEYDKKYIK